MSNEALESMYQNVKQKFANNPKVTIVRAFSPEAAELFEDNFFDWVYIDGNHNYSAIKNDLIRWYTKVKQGGLIAGHDYNNTPTSQVVTAVNEFLLNNNLQMLYLTVEKVPSYAFIRT